MQGDPPDKTESQSYCTSSIEDATNDKYAAAWVKTIDRPLLRA
jgi:hypothetical protein